MTVVPPAAAPAPVAASRARRAWALAGSITLAVLCALLAVSAAGLHTEEGSPFPPAVIAVASAGVLPMIGAAVLLVWRHRFPVLVSVLATALTLVLPTTPLTALVALAALTAARTGWLRWVMVGAVYLATAVSFCWDVASRTSLLSDFVGEPAAGTPARLALFWAVPVLAALAVAPFAAYGIVRGYRRERDAARLGTAAATRNVAVLHREVERERERQELARELHDTLAARLSSLSLHAGALELAMGEKDERATQTARLLRESAQHSLDDLRTVVNVLRNPAAAGSGTGLADLAALIDGAVQEGVDVRAQVLLTDPGSCDRRTAHACYRLVQESISNARRHAPGSVIRIDVRGGPETGLTISAVNWIVPGLPPTSVGGGNGLPGMSERVALAGGSFQAGPTPDGTFAVIAWLPWRPR